MEYMALKDIRSGDFRLQPRMLNPTHQGAALGRADLSAGLLEALPCWAEDFLCLISNLDLNTVPCKMLRAPCLPCCLLGLQTETLGLGFVIPH